MKRVLIVDDAIELGKVLKVAISTLAAELTIEVVPSAEEALLEMREQPIDLLIADIRLPGLSGLEMVKKAKSLYPEINVIVITGLKDAELKEQTDQLRVDAFFRKPMEMEGFLQACQECLHISEPEPILYGQNESISRDFDGELSESLSRLRYQWDAICVILMDPSGKIQAISGEMPDRLVQQVDKPIVLGIQKAGSQLSRLFDDRLSEMTALFHGGKYDILTLPLGGPNLLMTWNAGESSKFLSMRLENLLKIQKEFSSILSRMGIGDQPDNTVVETSIENEKSIMADSSRIVEETEKTGKEEIGLEAFESSLTKGYQQLDSVDLEAYWDKATDSSDYLAASPDSLSYEEAKKLGFTPEED